jgi:RNA polymerase sigma factor (sigma-70 family)
MVIPMENDDFDLLMRRVAEGSEEAAREVVDRYGGLLRRAIRRAMDSRLRCIYDSLDFVQDVWGSVFREPNRLERFKDPEDLVNFLVTLGHNKVLNEARRRLGTEKSNLDKEIPTAPDRLDQCVDTPGRFPSAVETAAAEDEFEWLLRDLSPEERVMVQLRSQGVTYAEIGAAVQKPETTVRDFFARLRRKKRCA